MAIVKSFSAEMVRDLSGVVDFYYWKGIPVARLWPRKSKIPPSEAMISAQAAFTQSRIDLRSVSCAVRAAWVPAETPDRFNDKSLFEQIKVSFCCSRVHP